MVKSRNILFRAAMAAGILLLGSVLGGCVRRELVDPGNTHYVRVYIDNEIRNVTTGFYNPDYVRPSYSDPQALRIMLCDRMSGRAVAERYLRNRHEDERGVYYDGYVICDAGTYDVMAYNFGTESTILRNEQSLPDVEAYTNPVAPHILGALASRARADEEEIVYMPDHLYRSEYEGVRLAPSMDIDTLRTPSGDWLSGASVVESWYLQLRIEGAQYVSSIAGLITGMGGSVKLHGAALQPPPVTILMDFHTDDDSPTGAVLYTTFHTFGRLPGESNTLELTFDITTTDGRAHVATIDITDEFLKPAATEHRWLLLDKTLKIPEPEPGSGEGGGGFVPGITDWTDVNTDIII